MDVGEGEVVVVDLEVQEGVSGDGSHQEARVVSGAVLVRVEVGRRVDRQDGLVGSDADGSGTVVDRQQVGGGPVGTW